MVTRISITYRFRWAGSTPSSWDGICHCLFCNDYTIFHAFPQYIFILKFCYKKPSQLCAARAFGFRWFYLSVKQGEKGISLELTDSARASLLEIAKRDLKFGGRGIGNAVESYLINPLSRAIMDKRLGKESCMTITHIGESDSFDYSIKE